MELETNMEQSANQQDAFLEGWDPEEYREPETEAEETTEVTESESEPNTTEQSETETPAADEATETPAETDNKPAEADEWVINYMGKEEKFTKADVTAEILQKGRDYDRIRAKYDEAKPVIELVSSLAAKANKSVGDYIKAVRAEAKRAEGLSEEEALRTVELEDREAAVSAAEAEKQIAEQNKNSENERVRADLELFGKLYPDVYEQAKGNFSVIPQTVWDAVHKGESLPVAYKKYNDEKLAQEKQELLARANAAEQAVKNAGRSTGSMKSAGSDAKNTDPFLDGWDN